MHQEILRNRANDRIPRRFSTTAFYLSMNQSLGRRVVSENFKKNSQALPVANIDIAIEQRQLPPADGHKDSAQDDA
jgi:hypothetical protein